MSWLANLVAITHGLLVIAVISGSLAAVIGLLRHMPKLERAYYALVVALIASDLFLGGCALTGLEKRLREANAAGSAYRDSYIGHYASFLPPVVHDYGGPALVAMGLLALPGWRMRDWLAGRRVAHTSQVSADKS